MSSQSKLIKLSGNDIKDFFNYLFPLNFFGSTVTLYDLSDPNSSKKEQFCYVSVSNDYLSLGFGYKILYSDVKYLLKSKKTDSFALILKTGLKMIFKVKKETIPITNFINDLLNSISTYHKFSQIREFFGELPKDLNVIIKVPEDISEGFMICDNKKEIHTLRLSKSKINIDKFYSLDLKNISYVISISFLKSFCIFLNKDFKKEIGLNVKYIYVEVI